MPFPNTISSLERVSAIPTFSSTESCKHMLTVFKGKLLSGDIHTTMISPVQGATGFTFLCSMRAEESTGFVLKWQSEARAKNERLCTALVQKFGFSTPDMCIVEDEELSRDLVVFARNEKPSMPEPGQSERYPLALIAMNRFKASTFKEVVKKGEFFSLPLADQEQIFHAFGKIIVFDLLVGNDDRIVRIEKNWKDAIAEAFESCSLESKPMMNYGNVMLEIERVDSQAHLRHIHFIDNASNPNLFKTKPVIENEIDFFCRDLFGADGDSLLEDPPAPILKTIDLKEKYQQLFSRVFQGIIANPEIFADHSLDSISNAIDELTQELPRLRAQWSSLLSGSRMCLQQSLLAGIANGLKLLQENYEVQLKPLDLTSEDHLELVKENIITLNSIRDK